MKTTDYMKELDNLIDSYEKSIEIVQSKFKDDMIENKLTLDLAEKLSFLSEESIKSMSLIDINALFDNTGSSTDVIKEEYYKSSDKSITFNEYSIDILLKIKSQWESILESKDRLKEIKIEKLNIAESYISAMKSPEYREARLEHLKLLKQMADKETDEIKKKTLIKRLDTIEKSQNFSFLLDRLYEYGKKEVDSLMSSYFERNKGTYSMKRYYDRLQKLGINQAIHRAFFNIEDNFLPETYAPFNNFFLFHVIRFIGYTDINSETDYLYMSSIIGALRDLVTGDATEEEKNTLIGVIKEFYSFFNTPEIEERFKTHNSNYKLHPDRIASEAKIVEMKKKEALEKIKLELDELYDNNTSYDDPINYLNNLYEEKKSMLEYIVSNGYPDYKMGTYANVFNKFNEVQKELPEVISKNDVEVTDDGN